ncbi:MAG: ribosome biogenesis GTPase YlqF, partial [Lachnospiraceae bacterium]|nr:ribosome biogenesis GTPase YlqF [Lachnospiraceae bacterium]
MNIQWYPGHMTKARRMMEEDIKLIDLVIELVDARLPLSSRNPDIDNLAKNKARLILLNKADLADERANNQWTEYF